MSHSNGKITAPINLAGDVYATLGIGPTSDGYELGYACANTHGKINPWARYKPVRYESLAPGPNEKMVARMGWELWCQTFSNGRILGCAKTRRWKHERMGIYSTDRW